MCRYVTPTALAAIIMASALSGCQPDARPPSDDSPADDADQSAVTAPERPAGIGVEVDILLRTAPTFDLLTLNPTPTEGVQPTDGFYGNQIMGRAAIEDPQTRGDLLTSLYRSMAESDGTAAGCFNPRHGIHASDGERSVDLVICFECLQLHIRHGETLTSALMTQSAHATFDRVRVDLGLPAAKQ